MFWLLLYGYAPIDALFEKADAVSLHCPLTPETKHIINQDTLSHMKDGSMLINTSRGGLINTEAVIQALKHGKLGFLGIDVYEQEEALFFQDLSETVIQDDTYARLMTFTNVLITAHQAFFTHNALSQIAKTTLQNVKTYEESGQIPDDNTVVPVAERQA